MPKYVRPYVWNSIYDEIDKETRLLEQEKEIDKCETCSEHKSQSSCPDHFFEYCFIMREISYCWFCKCSNWFKSLTGSEICKYHNKQLATHRIMEAKCTKCFHEECKYYAD